MGPKWEPGIKELRTEVWGGGWAEEVIKTAFWET